MTSDPERRPSLMRRFLRSPLTPIGLSIIAFVAAVWNIVAGLNR